MLVHLALNTFMPTTSYWCGSTSCVESEFRVLHLGDLERKIHDSQATGSVHRPTYMDKKNVCMAYESIIGADWLQCWPIMLKHTAYLDNMAIWNVHQRPCNNYDFLAQSNKWLCITSFCHGRPHTHIEAHPHTFKDVSLKLKLVYYFM